MNKISVKNQEGAASLPHTWWIVLLKKMSGHSGKKISRKSRNSCRLNGRGCGCTGTVTQGAIMRNPTTKYKRSNSIFFVTFSALICARMCTQLWRPLAQFQQGVPVRGYRDSLLLLATVREAVTIWCQAERNRRDTKSIFWVFVLVSGLALFGLSVKLSVCSHTPTVHSTTISRFPKYFLAPHFFSAHHSPSNLAESLYPPRYTGLKPTSNW